MWRMKTDEAMYNASPGARSGHDTCCTGMLTFEGECSWKRRGQGNRGCVHETDGWAVYTFDGFGGGDIDEFWSCGVDVGDEAEMKKVWECPLEDVDGASFVRERGSCRQEVEYQF